jgi:sulfur carrier protein ThiS adenylyltransferase
MNIRINEQHTSLPDGTTLFAVRGRCKPEADVLIVNGSSGTGRPAPAATATALCSSVAANSRAATELEALMAARHTPGVHERVKQACVGIAGAGGLGSSVAMALARIGIGRLILADFDVVEPSNLNRQQYFVDQIGHAQGPGPASDNLVRINPYVRVDVFYGRLTPDNVGEVFADAEILVEAFDAADAESHAGGELSPPLPAASPGGGFGVGRLSAFQHGGDPAGRFATGAGGRRPQRRAPR